MMLRLLFILSGGQFYLDWLLVTNPISKNPVIRFLWGWNKEIYSAYDYRNRLWMAFIFGGIHVFGSLSLLSLSWYSSAFWFNVFGNLYPTIVQIYVGTRCWQLMHRKKKRAVKNKLKTALYRLGTDPYNPAKSLEKQHVEVG